MASPQDGRICVVTAGIDPKSLSSYSASMLLLKGKLEPNIPVKVQNLRIKMKLFFIPRNYDLFNLAMLAMGVVMVKDSSPTSIIAVYITTLLGITAIGTILTTFILRIHHRPAGSRVGERTEKLVMFLKMITCSLTDEDKQVPKNSISPEDSRLHAKGVQTYQLSSSYLGAAEGSRGQTTAVKRNPRTADLANDNGTKRFDDGSDQTGAEPTRPVSCPPVYQQPMTWQEVADVYDWFLFLLFTGLTCLLTITVLIILPVGGNSRAPTLNKTGLN
ncbi:hypothetical protein RRG08_052140 [Elysia crispata]|uniref:Neurotransmitter-gated ion-channel transmembrane domain-containing protein n=1 Tax=Elysia crispata TaxID=231223 RepID=A0AAE1CMI1_9GAST|nr:hypothetical protein RRG08_052140 [Elysia crispata]